jgi:hypothetical protein
LDRRTKIQLLDHWLSNPESMGDIPDEFKGRVTTHDFFDIKREMGWKPLTRENVERLLHGTKYLGMEGGGKVGRKGNPAAVLIVMGVMMLPFLFSVIPESGYPFSYLNMAVFIVFGLVFMGIFLRLSLHAVKKKI